MIKLLLTLMEKFKNFKKRLKGEQETELFENNPVQDNKVSEKTLEKTISTKFFGKKTLFDEAKKVEVELSNIKEYSPENYDTFKKNLDKLIQEAKIFYEEQENKNEFSLTLSLNVKDPLDIHGKFYTLLEQVKSFKKESFNYEYALKRLEELKTALSSMYLSIIVDKTRTDLLEKSKKTLVKRINEISNLSFDENTVQQEKVCKSMCEAIYIFFKSNAWCNNYCSDTEFREIFLMEEITFWETFKANAKDLLEKTSKFPERKYREEHQGYLKKILDREDVEYKVLLAKEFLENFVRVEKRILELNYYYEKRGLLVGDTVEVSAESEPETGEEVSIKTSEKTNEDFAIVEDMVNISHFSNYINNLLEVYKDDDAVVLKLYLLAEMLNKFKCNITCYEAYKLIYFFGLKTFFTSHLKNASNEDLMNKIFESQKGKKITSSKKVKNLENAKLYKLLSYEQSLIGIESVNKVLNNLNIYFEDHKCDDFKEIRGIYFLATYFEDDENIMKNLENVSTRLAQNNAVDSN